jgi:hypothetical protein
VQILEHADRRAERTKQLRDGAKDAVPFGPCVPEWFERRWQQLAELWKERPECPSDRTELERRAKARRATHGVDHRPERKRFAEGLAVAGEHCPALHRGQIEELADEASLPDAGLAFDDGDGRRADRRLAQEIELLRPADENG